jgi:aminoglycoside 6'-N-acetyltransferase I
MAVSDVGIPVGFVELSIRSAAAGCGSDRIGYLEGWYVVPAWRRRGVGRTLVAAGEAWARGNGCTEFASDALIDNPVSQAAHRALGFTEVEAIVCFRKDLGGVPGRGLPGSRERVVDHVEPGEESVEDRPENRVMDAP